MPAKSARFALRAAQRNALAWLRVAGLGLLLGAALSGCVSSATSFRAYVGDIRSAMQVAIINGGELVRSDLMNRYVDVVRFLRVDEMDIASESQVASVEVVPGYREIEVFYSWDHGSQRGLAPALVDYAATQESISRVLRFYARSGETYTVRAEPSFQGERRDITTLAYVDFWVEDAEGGAVVAPERATITPRVTVN
mgnify:CR=1 FL=1